MCCFMVALSTNFTKLNHPNKYIPGNLVKLMYRDGWMAKNYNYVGMVV